MTYDVIRRRTRLWSFLLLVLAWFLIPRCCDTPTFATVRYAETLITKASGSLNAVVLPGASVYAFSPGATASAACSGSTISVYSNTNIADSDVVEISSTGLTFTVTGHTSTTVTVSGSPTCSSGDRLLRTNSQITIYRDDGGTSTITQPAISDANGKIVFFTNASGFDLKATASNGLRVISYGILTGSGASGGWTEAGSETTTTDAVGIGVTSSLGAKLHIKETSTQTAGTPTAEFFELEGSTGQKFGIYCASDKRCYLRDINETTDMLGWGNGSGSSSAPRPFFFGTVASAVGLSNPGTINLFQEGSAVRGIVLQRSASGSSGNLIELRDQTGATIGFWAPSANLSAQTVTGTTGSFTDTGTTSLAGAGRVTGSTFTATTSAAGVSALTIPSPGKITINGDQYAWPADYPTTSGYHLASTTAGDLSWVAPVAGCAGAYHTVAIVMPAHNFNGSTVISPGTFYCSLNTNFIYADNGFGGTFRYYGCDSTQTTVDDFFTPPGSGAQSVSMWAKADANVGAGASVAVNIQSDASDVGSTCTMAAGSAVCTGPTNQSFSLASGHKWNLKVVVSGTASISELLVTYCFGL